VSKFLTAPDLGPPVSRGAIDSQQNQQLELEGGCNAIIPRDFVVRGSCSIPTAATNHPICLERFSDFARRQKAAVRNKMSLLGGTVALRNTKSISMKK
jgi:hypothetical protein